MIAVQQHSLPAPHDWPSCALWHEQAEAQWMCGICFDTVACSFQKHCSFQAQSTHQDPAVQQGLLVRHGLPHKAHGQSVLANAPLPTQAAPDVDGCCVQRHILRVAPPLSRHCEGYTGCWLSWPQLLICCIGRGLVCCSGCRAALCCRACLWSLLKGACWPCSVLRSCLLRK